ncbi:phosphogluconate dehydrogenase (NAD(+)-dependent, decarboxylating) [Heyndrickxia coagulans]|jgi:6-phosphogluconate dehydrogenase|uniref:6-phosphogluconate dehydrogenase, decarboxylating n=2 Tax=Heyndrickxia coagulans TaxID=1398 RepID=A0A150JY92_HEYCO|nr:decarboxylating 6-phosphogluconate dehydrogenase [Heyndrickxia coagulans]AEH52270.1 6-phosphogluconate dehydrogenase, decarboxylating [Heyndrickxia coagulans 2-6]AJH78792.1 6-phosphogluconate dehydrogenase [Heyndrickxia coagulans DSM 1 = ATCC 7050]KYC62259.1 6-phosphogluconate dehydrogenase, decarboxylating [Heyndrickxia coagulans]MCR2845962.1 decarboxylating 6-phosphogluconate dehydrogenase [Heyndrickxia coagulans]MDR4223675.1 decarboxylating 6-phosphogluconate dehydrogenase [Heyndrickxia 
MEIGIVGLGKMGMNLSLNMLDHQVDVKAYDTSRDATAQLSSLDSRAKCFPSLEALVQNLEAPRKIWVMVPSGEPTNETINKLSNLLSAGDIVIDGGNSHYTDSCRHYTLLQNKGIHFLDVGTSGGISGARHGACLMIGGDKPVFDQLEPLFEKISEKDGYLYTGKPGSGHFLKMVHNGIEYGMMEALAEGFEILEKSPYDYDNQAVAKVWNHGSVIRSWLVELLEDAFSKDAHLDEISGVMASSGEGKWTVETALDLQASIPVIALSLMNRYRSLEKDTFTGKVVAALRNEFGGHAVTRSGQ